MTLYILDTDHVSLFQREHSQVVARIRETPSEQRAIAIITVEGQLRGRLAQIRRASHKSFSVEARIKAYTELKVAVHFFNNIHILDFDQEAEHQFSKLRKKKIRIGVQDLRIASIALAIKGILVTRNRQDFEKVPGLMIENWV